MDYEQKYTEALEKIREGLQPLQDGTKISGVTRAFLEEVFPELKESEDEKIRKALVRFHKSTVDVDGIKSLEDRVQPKPTEWSDEDEEYLRRAINATKDGYPMTTKWLKSLKTRLS